MAWQPRRRLVFPFIGPFQNSFPRFMPGTVSERMPGELSKVLHFDRWKTRNFASPSRLSFPHGHARNRGPRAKQNNRLARGFFNNARFINTRLFSLVTFVYRRPINNASFPLPSSKIIRGLLRV